MFVRRAEDDLKPLSRSLFPNKSNMYFAIGWPKQLDTSSFGDQAIRQICCDRVKILFAVLTDDTLAIWYSKPCVPIVSSRRCQQSLLLRGPNQIVEWKPDSNALVVATTDGTLLVYRVSVDDADRSIYNQIDPPSQNLKRDSAELFVKEAIPSLQLQLVVEKPLFVPVTCLTCVNVNQMMIATRSEKILRIRWDGEEERDFSLDLKRIPFSINQQVSYAVPLVEANTYVNTIDYSPLIGGFSITLNDGRAAYLTAGNLKFDPNQVQGIWAQHIEDATCGSINHKHRLIAFGRRNSQAAVFTIDDVTGGLELSHTMELSAKDYPGAPGAVRELKWTPDGCAVAVSWANGGVSLWSTYGTMLMCSLGWDYGLHVDLTQHNPLDVHSMDWSTEGYQLLMMRQQTIAGAARSSLVQLDFVKSSLAVNPCMSTNAHLFLQGDDKLYINPGDSLQRVYHNCNVASSLNLLQPTDDAAQVYAASNSGKHGNIFSQSYNICTDKYLKGDFMPIADELQPHQHPDHAQPLSSAFPEPEDYEVSNSLQVSSMLAESKHWVVVQLPVAYMATNWPIRFSAIDATGMHLAAAGRTGVAVYSMATRKWKLFGNERQEKDFLVTGGLLWWDAFLVMGCYSLEQQTDELRLYPRDAKLDNRFGKVVQVSAPVMLINLFEDQLVVFTADGFVTIYACVKTDPSGGGGVDLVRVHSYDIRGLCVHPACIVSVTLTTLRNDVAGTRASQGNVLLHQQPSSTQPETIILNVSGRILMVNREINGNGAASSGGQLTSTCLASCVECLWVSTSKKMHLRESLWLYCGGHGMRVWLPVFPRGDRTSGHGSHRHTFMSKRIMLSFQLRVYPLAILFEDAIILGAENDTTLYTSDAASPFSVPFCFLKKTSQVYLHQILRQLIRRNLGYNAWEIAGSCTNLPYFPHSLELLLHEVLEEEATSKEPIPDALLPSVLEFIQEFPVYLQTVVQCARKTEIALWPYLFASAGKPKELFQQCLARKQLETAASYLIILQNLEPSSVSRQYATILLETALDQQKWDLAKDLVRFLRAIDPNDVESPRNSFVMGAKLGGHNSHHHAPATSALSPNAEELSLILGTTMTRGRSFSTTAPPNKDGIPAATGVGAGAGAGAAAGSLAHGKPSATMSPVTDWSTVQRRKKSVPHTQREKDSAPTEEFFIEVILQRHARRLLQEKRLEALGYMSAALDFHLVGWLARERDRSARVEEFVSTLKQLHDDLEWPKPNLDLKLSSGVRRNSEVVTAQQQQQDASPSYSLQSNNRIDQQADSGYTSLPAVPTGGVYFAPHSTTPSEQSNTNTASTLFHPELSTAALQSMNAKFGDLCRISEEGEALAHSVAAAGPYATFPTGSTAAAETEAKLVADDTASVASETVSMWADDSLAAPGDQDPNTFIGGLHTSSSSTTAASRTRRPSIPPKLEIKVRYLLQLFTEAGCLDLALLLSVLLLDAASISRITNSAIRSGSLTVCRQLRNGLKDITRWSFQECLGYRPFVLQLQQQVNLLDQFVIQQESIPQAMMIGGTDALEPIGGKVGPQMGIGSLASAPSGVCVSSSGGATPQSSVSPAQQQQRFASKPTETLGNRRSTADDTDAPRNATASNANAAVDTTKSLHSAGPDYAQLPNGARNVPRTVLASKEDTSGCAIM